MDRKMSMSRTWPRSVGTNREPDDANRPKLRMSDCFEFGVCYTCRFSNDECEVDEARVKRRRRRKRRRSVDGPRSPSLASSTFGGNEWNSTGSSVCACVCVGGQNRRRGMPKERRKSPFAGSWTQQYGSPKWTDESGCAKWKKKIDDPPDRAKTGNVRPANGERVAAGVDFEWGRASMCQKTKKATKQSFDLDSRQEHIKVAQGKMTKKRDGPAPFKTIDRRLHGITNWK